MSKKNQGPQTPEGYSGYIDASSIGATPWPQVNLLPPDVRARRAMGGVKLRLALALGLVIAVLALAVFFTTQALADAERDYEEKQARVAALQAEIATYSDVPKIKQQLADTYAARDFAMSTEIMWADYLGAIEAVAPEGWTLTTMTAAFPTPMQDTSVPASPIAQPAVAQIQFQGKSLTLPDISLWLEAMASVPGFSDPSFSAAELTEDDGTVYFETTATVQVNEQAFALRFVETEGEEG